MSYSQPIQATYSRAVALTNTSWTIAPPVGCSKCQIVDINLSTTTTWTATTTSATLKVGVTNSLDALGSLTFGTTAAGTALNLGSVFAKGTNPTVLTLSTTGSTNPVVTANTVPEVLGPITLTFAAPTGGTPAGAGVVDVIVNWFV